MHQTCIIRFQEDVLNITYIPASLEDELRSTMLTFHSSGVVKQDITILLAERVFFGTRFVVGERHKISTIEFKFWLAVKHKKYPDDISVNQISETQYFFQNEGHPFRLVWRKQHDILFFVASFWCVLNGPKLTTPVERNTHYHLRMGLPIPVAPICLHPFVFSRLESRTLKTNVTQS